MVSGDVLKQLRLEKGLTLEKVSNIVGVGKSTVRKWETGYISNMGVDKLVKLAAALGVSVDYILGLPVSPQNELSSIADTLSPEGKVQLIQYAKFLRSQDKKA